MLKVAEIIRGTGPAFDLLRYNREYCSSLEDDSGETKKHLLYDSTNLTAGRHRPMKKLESKETKRPL